MTSINGNLSSDLGDVTSNFRRQAEILGNESAESTNLGVVVAKSGVSFFGQKEPPRRDKSIAHSGARNGDD